MVSKIDLGILALGALAVFLIIRGAGQKLDNLANPLAGVSLPSLPSFELPSISLPNLPDIFGDSGGSVNVGTPQDRPVPSSLIPTEQERIEGNQSILEGLGLGGAPSFEDRPLNLSGFISQVPEQSPEENREVEAMNQVQSQIQGQQFQGGGLGFIGGSVSEIPLSNLSLGGIIERFGVTASQAADIRARARDDFGGFDFGSNTGRGIGSVVQEIPELRSMLPNIGAVSNPEFTDLSAQEIALRLTGGNISNF